MVPAATFRSRAFVAKGTIVRSEFGMKFGIPFSQCASRSESGQAAIDSFIAQCAGLDSDFEGVVDQWNAELHAEFRAHDCSFGHKC
jgi:hypothetical protein